MYSFFFPSELNTSTLQKEEQRSEDPPGKLAYVISHVIMSENTDYCFHFYFL